MLKARILLRQWSKGQHLLWQASQAEGLPPIGLDAQAHDAVLAPAPVIAKALGYHDKTATRLVTEAVGTWSRYAPGDHTWRLAGRSIAALRALHAGVRRSTVRRRLAEPSRFLRRCRAWPEC
ncbi:hypothetical protein GCM10010304_63690 [Streptomyces roseoviolaceus]